MEKVPINLEVDKASRSQNAPGEGSQEPAKEKVELFSKDDIHSHPLFYPNGHHKPLFDAIRNENLIVFYGAGVSQLAGCCGWVELAKRIIKEFSDNEYSNIEKNVLTDMANNDPRKAISICYSRAKNNNKLEDAYFKAIKESVTPSNNRKFADIHEKLLDLNAICYVTTNIDKGMETVNNMKLTKKKIINATNPSPSSDLAKEIRNGNIFYLHGSVDDLRNTIFTIQSYLKFYYKSPAITHFLKKIFGGNFSVLFIGYSLSEYEILQNIFLSLDAQDKEIIQSRHFLLTPIYTKDLAKFNVEKDFFKIFSVETIPYFIDYDGYERLSDVLSSLRAKIHEYTPETLKVFKDIDEV